MGGWRQTADKGYGEHLKEYGLTILETRRLRGDQLEVCKILTFLKDQCRLDIIKYLFSQRTINEWKKLSAHCVNATNMF